MSATDSAPSASRRPATTTFAPRSANAIAVARPMPEVPPVIRITFSVNDVFMVMVPSYESLMVDEHSVLCLSVVIVCLIGLTAPEPAEHLLDEGIDLLDRPVGSFFRGRESFLC